VPFLYFLWKSLTLRVGDTWPMFLWPAGFAAAAINLVQLPREGWPDWIVKSTFWWARVAVISGIAFVVVVFFYYVAAPWNLIGKTDPVGGEAGYEQVAARAREQLQATGATWIATSDYRTYAMLRWHFNGEVPVIQINERGRFQGFRDPGINAIKGHPGLYVAREPDHRSPLWNFTTAKRQPLARVERVWRGVVMDTYALEKLTDWTPELSPSPESPLFRWRVLAWVVQSYAASEAGSRRSSTVTAKGCGPFASLRAQRRNPFFLAVADMDCVAALATMWIKFRVLATCLPEGCISFLPFSKLGGAGLAHIAGLV